MMATALVTGGNKGIGLAVCRTLAKQGIAVVLTARDEQKGKNAVEMLSEEGLSVTFCRLDVTEEESIRDAAEFVKKEFGELDILINNAGVLLDFDDDILSVSRKDVEESFNVNTLGPLLVSQGFSGLLGEGSRIVNVSSRYGQLNNSSEEGFCPSYRISKCALNTVTKLLANSLGSKNVLVNSVCPGWVRTDIGGDEAQLSPDEGAKTIVWLATSPEVEDSGGFFRDMQRIDW